MPKQTKKTYSIQQAAELLKVSTKTLRRWEARGVITPVRTDGGHRRYTISEIQNLKPKDIRKHSNKNSVVAPQMITSVASTHTAPVIPQNSTTEVEIAIPIKSKTNPRVEVEEIFITETSPELYETPTYTVVNSEPIQKKSATKYISVFTLLIGVLLIGHAAKGAYGYIANSHNIVPAVNIATNNQVLADTSTLEQLQYRLNIPATFAEIVTIDSSLEVSETASIDGTLTLGNGIIESGVDTLALNADTTSTSGNLAIGGTTLTSAADLTIDAAGGGVRIGTGTQALVDLSGDDLFVTGDTEIAGTTYIETLVINGDSFTDLTGTGLQVSGGVLSTTLGTSVTGDEIENDTIKEVDLTSSNNATNGQILSYNSSTGGFTWVAGASTLFTDGAGVTYLTDTSENLTIGSSTNLAKIGADGVADEVQLLAQGNSTQTSDIFVVEASDGTNIFSVGNTGNTTLTNSGSNNVAVNLTGTGDFVIQDNGTTFVTFTDSGTILANDLTLNNGTITSVGNLTLSPGSNFVVSTLDCTGNTNGGALTANGSGIISCSNDDGGGGASDWTSALGVVYLQTGTNSVNIGGTTDLGKLAVEGDADQVQLLVQGHTTQTNFLGLFEQAAGADVFSIANNGDLVSAGDLAVNGGDITTSSTTANLFNSGATTINFAGAATNLNVGVTGGTMTIVSNVTISGTLTTAASNFAADGATTLSPSGTNDVTINLDANSTLILNGVQSGTASNALCLDGSNNVITCQAAITVTLKDAYDNDADGSNATIALTSADDSIILSNPSSAGTDSGYILNLDQANVGGVDGLRVTQAGTGDSIELTNSSTGSFLNLMATGGGTTADGIVISATGVVTDAIDASDAEIVNALNIGANTILGGAGVIDFTSFDVDGSGNIVTSGTVTAATNETINGVDISAGTVTDVVNLTINSGGDLTIGAIGLNDAGTSNVDSGASLIGTFDEFTNSNSTNVQDVLDDLDSAIGAGASKWTDGGAITYLTATTDDLAVGASNTLVAPFSVDVSANLVRIGTGATANAQLDMYASDADTGSLVYNTSDQFNFTNGDVLISQALTVTGATITNGALTANGTFVLGDGGDQGSASTSDWAISTTGVLTGISGITTDGGYTQSGSTANTFTGATTISGGATISRTLTADATLQNVASITFTTPADTTGTNVNQGLNITPTIGNATGGTNTANIINVGAVTGDAQVILNALNVGALTGTAATETAINIGAGWDNVLSAGGSAIINGSGVLQSAGLSGTYSNALTLSSTSNSLTAGTLTINSDAFTDLTGSGLAISAGVLSVNLTTTGGTGSTSSNSGLEVSSSGLTLLRGCADSEILSWDDTGALWKCNTVTGVGGGDITAVGDVTSGAAFTPTAGNDGTTLYFDGATADGNEIALTSADPGSDITVTLPNIAGTLASLAGTQTFSGAKTFSTTTTFDGAIAANTDADFTLAGSENVTIVNTSASADQLSIAASGITTTGIDALSLALTQSDDADATDTNSALNIALTSSSGDADTLFGIQFEDFTGGTSVETGIRFGTGFNNLFQIEGNTADGNDTSITFTEPTGVRSIIVPDDSGTICLSSGNCVGGAGGSKWTDGGTVTYLTSTTDDVAVGGSSLASAFSVDVSANLVRIGTGSTASAQIDLYASDADTGSLTYNTSDQFSFSGGDVLVGQALTVNGAFTLGDTGDTGAIDTSDWDISTTGVMTGISGITTDGGYTQSGSTANTFTGATTISGGATISRTLTADATLQNVASITFTTPADTTGTNVNQGLNITPTIGNATGGTNTANIINVGAVTGDAQVILNALNIGALTGTAAAETAINIGAGWDNILSVGGTPVINGSGQIISTQLTGTLFSTSSDSGTSTVIQGDTLAVNGGTNGVDTALSGDTYTINLDTTEIGTTTFGSGSAIVWTFDASAGTDTSFTFGNNTQTLTTGTLTLSGTTALTASSLTTFDCVDCINFDDISDTLTLDAATTITRTSTTTSEDSLAYSLVNDGGTAGTDQALVISNGVSTNAAGDVTTEALLVLNQADTMASGNTALTDALLITNSGGSTLTNGITIGSGSQAITTALNIASTGVTTDISLQNGETIDNNSDGVVTITSGSTALSGDLAINGGNITTAFTADSTVTVTGTTTTNGTLTANGLFTLGDNGDTGAINTSDWDISVTGDLTGIGSITSDGAISFTPGGSTDITFTLDADTTLILTGVQAGTATNGLCLNGTNDVITCSTAGSTTLQTAYDADADGSDSTIALTVADDSIVFNNPAASGTDSGYILNLDQDATGAVDGLRVNQAGTGAGITMTFTNAGTTADAIIINNSAGTITDAIDVSDATGITNALNIGANAIVGTTANIDLTNFDVTGGTGNVTTAGDIAVNGDDITSDGNLTLAATGYVRIGDSGTPGAANGDDDLYVEGDFEVDATATFDSTITVAGTATLNGTLDANGQVDLGDGGDTLTASATTLAFTSNGAGNDIRFTTADDLILNPGDDITTTFVAGSQFIIDADTTNTTTTGGVIDLNVGTSTTGSIGFNLDFSLDDDADATDTVYASSINLTNSSAEAGDVIYGQRIQQIADGSATGDKVTDALLLLDNADTATGDDITVADAILITSSGAIANGVVDAIDASDTNITNALNAGDNFILGNGIRQFSASSTVWTFEDTAGNDLLTITDAGSDGNLNVTGDLAITGGNVTTAVTFDSTLTTTGTLTANGSFIANGAFTLGDNGDTGSINTSDWDISTTGDMTGIGAITADGIISQTYAPVGTLATAYGVNLTPVLGVDIVDQSLSAIRIAANTNANSDSGDTYFGINVDTITATAALQYAIRMGSGYDSIFQIEGATDDGSELFVTLVDPTTDQTITFPDDTGTVCLSSGNCSGGAGGSKWTDGGAITYLTSTTDDVAVGASNTLVAPFSVDVSANLTRFGTGATANAQLDLYASDADTGSLVYTTSDQFNFTGGDILISQALTTNGNTTLGDANTDTITINAGTSGTGITLADATFANCQLTTVSNVVTCGSSSGMTSFTVAGDSGGGQSITNGNTLSVVGGTNGIDTVDSVTDTVTINLDTTEIGTTTFGSGSAIVWTFDASAGTDTSFTFGNNTQTLTTGTLTLSGTTALTGTSLTSFTGGATAIDFTEFDVSATTGGITINDGADAGFINIESTNLDINDLTFVGAGTIGTGNATALTLDSGTTGTIAIGTDASAETINLGTGAAAKTVVLGSTNTTSGTTVQSGTGDVTISSADDVIFNLLDNNTDALDIQEGANNYFNINTTNSSENITLSTARATGGDAITLQANSITTGVGVGLDANAITSGTALDLSSTSAVVTSGSSIANGGTALGSLLNVSLTGNSAFTGNLGTIDWSPTSSTLASGDLFQINIGSNGSTSGYLFNISDAATSLFSVSETQITSALPHQFTAAGDVAVAYDLQFTNQSASSIKANAPLTIDTGESFESNNLTLRTYNSGNVIIDLGATAGKLSVGANISPAALLHVSDTGTGAIGKSLAIFDQDESQHIITASASGVSKFALDNAGKLYVGALDVETANTTATCWFNNTINGVTLKEITDCNGTPTDLAEYFGTTDTSIEAGDIITLDGQAEPVIVHGTQTSKAFVQKSNTQYDHKAIGIISTAPNQVYGDDGVFEASENPRPVSLAGRVPVKVTTRNGAIRVGDAITSSDIAGVGMKATNNGFVVGRAMQDYTEADTNTVGKIIVFVNPTYYDPIDDASYEGTESAELGNVVSRLTNLEEEFDSVVSSSLTASTSGILASFNDVKTNSLSVLGDTLLSNTVINGTLNIGTMIFDSLDQSINAVGTLKIQSLALGNIELQGGLVTIDTTGNVVVNTITAQKYKVAGASAGTGTLTAGTQEISITTDMVSANSLIFVTPKQATTSPLAVTEKIDGESFTVEISDTQSGDIEFDWFIVDKVN